LEKFKKFLRELRLSATSAPNRHPFNIVVGNFSSVISLQSTMVPSVKDGTLVMNAHVSNAKLPSCSYLCIISPAIGDGNSINYSEAFAAINFARAFLCLNFGSLVQYTPVLELDFDMQGQIGIPGDVLRVPMFAELARILDASIANETAARLALQLPDLRQKYRRACDFMSHALNQRDEAFRFSAYWIALEVLAGTGEAIKDELASAYGESKKFVEDELCFKELAEMRIQLMHFGKFGMLLSYHERLFHFYFWEIIRHQICLPCRRLALGLFTGGTISDERNYRKTLGLQS